MRHHPRHIILPAAILLAATLACTMTASAAIPETMDGRTTVVSVRTFDTGVTQHADLTVEAASVTVPDDAAWDGGEQLDVPHTESPAERKQREQKEREQAEARQAAERQAQAASRSALRATLPDGWDSNAVLTEASKYLDVPYVYGGSSPADSTAPDSSNTCTPNSASTCHAPTAHNARGRRPTARRSARRTRSPAT